MQGKGFIKFIAIVLAIVCAYALSFTLVASKVEKDAKNYAKGDAAKEKAYLDSMSTEKVYPLVGFTYGEVKSKEINLGLDLKGGMNVTMEISLAELVKSLAGNPTDANFNKAVQNAQIQLNAGGKDYIKIFVDEFEKLSPGVKLADYFSNQDNASQLKPSASNGEVESFLEKEATSAIDRSFTVLRSRIDGFGVVSPNMQKQEGSNRILIEMPGVQDKERIAKLLQGSAELQFWQVYQVQEVAPLLENINKTLAATLKTETPAATTDTAAKAGGKLAGLENAAKDSTAKGGKLAGLGKKDSTAVRAELAKSNPLYAVLSLPIYQGENGQQQLMPGAVVGMSLQKDTAKVNNYLKLPEVAAAIPSTMKFMWSVKPREGSKVFELYAIKVTSADGKPDLGGEAISDSRADFDQKGKPEVTMYMTSEGAAKWKKITAEAAADPNNKKSIAIVLDNMVYSAPTVQNEIGGGVSSITGNFTQADTKDLSNILKAGKLPAPARIAGSYIVGPTLGAQAIHDGLISFVIAFIVILIFMALYYHRAGWVANFALLVNLFFIIGILVSLGAVLTLPGIAGIVLTIGLSVDANILIFERVREELALGKNIPTAIKEGFKHAMPSILDANITVFILGAILYAFGSGPVQGFATTLCIGILSSLFAAVLISRLVFEAMLDRKMEISFDNQFTRNAFKNLAFNFVGRRKIYYIISTVIILAGIGMYFKHGGLNLGVDFKGGRTYLVHFDKAVNTEDIKSQLTPVFGNETPEVKTAGENSQVKITTTFHIEDQDVKTDKVVEDALNKGLAGSKYEIVSSQKVTPIIASDIVNGAFYAVLISCIFMFIYIVVRFKKWQYGLGAVLALAHDVLMVLSFYTILDGVLPFSLEIGQDFIAAILTVMGYTMTETVVVFDRIREKLKEAGKEDLHGEERNQLINFALNSTLSRTILTSLTVFFVLLVIFIFGGDSIRGFIFALLIGRVIGTYSSLCISTPIVIDLGSSEEKKK
ncbi:preprotein translocase subunit SecD [Pedobacter sp. Leaf41]|uniref:protein translocase subunit SecDF n=1 Tax=Pedobacter sp. Leaf41 TaxID=1736218 RepID=UPI000702F011|nr:protein translocase subunit SecDF [Pedobacter sp. Leaf41]KQN33330.1 preprotein translocase subunit SecD [Pedobacter sp. Leaf41]RZK66966.1 MAG: protein translocase subunit SecDF [Pedobacter sp.]